MLMFYLICHNIILFGIGEMLKGQSKYFTILCLKKVTLHSIFLPYFYAVLVTKVLCFIF